MEEINKTNPKVSVIIPMYKCRSFVSAALDMVCGQTLKDIEIICVLDGPDADIRDIVERRAEEDSRVIFLEQEHRGAGIARNTGMDTARGDYLLFLDADDLFKPEMVEKMHGKAVEMDADVVMCSYTQTNEWTNVIQKGLGFDFSGYSESEIVDCTKKDNLFGSFIPAAWNKLYRRQHIIDNNICFMGTRVMNDAFFVVTAMMCSNRLAVIKEDLLTVRRHVNNDSISTNRAKYSEDCVEVLTEIYQWIRNNGYWKKSCNDYYRLSLDTIHYQAGYDYNEKLVDRVAHMLSCNQPWKSMCNTEVVHNLELQIYKLVIKKNNQADAIAVSQSLDNSGREKQLHMYENRIKAFKSIRAVMKNKYGRDLSKKDNPIELLMWSIRYRGWNGTMRKILEKIQGEVVLEPKIMICPGHITSAGHYIVFFIPFKTYRETAYIEEISVAVRCDGYYPVAVSGREGDNTTPLGPKMTPVINGGVPTRKNEIIRAYTDVSVGLGIFVQLRFKEPLLKNKKAEKIGNNRPASVQITGRIHLK